MRILNKVAYALLVIGCIIILCTAGKCDQMIEAGISYSLKNTLIPLIIGAFLIFACLGIIKIGER